ncbi:MAG: D-glycerate dehydrogenase [Vicinamibacterales bacterium]
MSSVLVTAQLPPKAMDILEQAVAVEILPTGADVQALRDASRGRHAIVSLLTNRVDAALLDAAGPSLKVVSNVAVGYDNIDVAAARERGVIVTNTPDVLTNATAELTWGLILAVTRRLGEGERLVRDGRWTGWSLDFMTGMELSGKQLGILGSGRIGRAVAAKAAAFGMTAVFSSRHGAGEIDGHPVMSVDELIATSDVLSLHVPLRPDTRHLINRAALERMKRTAYLVNTARGPVVDEAALASALKERVIAGAALDVFEREPIVHPDLLGLENVVLVPHIGSATHETRSGMAELAARNVVAVLAGKPPLTPVG